MSDFEPKVKVFYNIDSVVYDQRWQSPGGLYTSETQADIVREICSEWMSENALEVGCGTGRFTPLLGSLFSNLSVVDLAYSMLRLTRERVTYHQIENSVQRFANASAYTLPLYNNSFDAIVSINVFSHLENPRKALSEFSRVQSAGGHLLLSLPNLYSYYFLPGLLVNLKRESFQRQVYSRWYKPSEISLMLSDAGYEILTVTGNTHIPKLLDKRMLRGIFRALDQKSRYSWLKKFAPIWFVECVRID